MTQLVEDMKYISHKLESKWRHTVDVVVPNVTYSRLLAIRIAEASL